MIRFPIRQDTNAIQYRFKETLHSIFFFVYVEVFYDFHCKKTNQYNGRCTDFFFLFNGSICRTRCADGSHTGQFVLCSPADFRNASEHNTGRENASKYRRPYRCNAV